MSKPASIRIQSLKPRHTVSPYIYSQFAEHLGRCIDGGIWVGERSSIPNEKGIRLDVTEALKRLQLPALRWPGGCFADNYHWRDGIGPREQRPRRYNLHWRQPETNAFGTHEFIQLCHMIETEPYICLNVGSGSPAEARDWVEYCNSAQDTTLVRERRANGSADPFNVKFWGIGNENWGCGGLMQPQYYADLYARFATYVAPTAGPGARMIACGSHPGIPEWDERFLDRIKWGKHLVHYLSLHIYAGLGTGVDSLNYTDKNYLQFVVDIIEEYRKNLERAAGVARAHSTPDYQIGIMLDEWGTWFADAVTENGLYQQSTMLDALFAAACFHCFHDFPTLFMANMAQTINVLQALILTQGSKMVLTPTYHVFEMFKGHRDGGLLDCTAEGSPAIQGEKASRAALSASATLSPDGKTMTVSVINLDPEQEIAAELQLPEGEDWKLESVRRLAADDLRAHNRFEAPESVIVRTLKTNELAALDRKITYPEHSITVIELNR